MEPSTIIRVGRPRLPESEKKQRLSVTVSQRTLAHIDKFRGELPRSTYIEQLLQAHKRQSTEEREILRRDGAVYTPPHLADFVAGKVLSFLADELRKSSEAHRGSADKPAVRRLRIIDPACGSGELLNATWGHLAQGKNPIIRSINGRPQCDPREILCGIEIDRRASEGAAHRLEALAIREGFLNRLPCRVLKTNALLPFDEAISKTGWERVRRTFSASDGFDVVIANPPWGADVSQYRHGLMRSGFSLLQGQFDTSDLFLEMSLKIVRPGGFIAFIIPDSLFSFERRHLRKLVLENTHIRFIGRMGEKLFEGINRACAVLICQKKVPPKDAQIQCLRLTPEARKRIFDGSSTLAKEANSLVHKVPQQRFSRNPNSSFDIDVREIESQTLGRIGGHKSSFGTYLISTRGIELSKTGKVCPCPHCKVWLPAPSASKAVCPHCKKPISGFTNKITSIVRKSPVRGAVPLIVGEAVDRYRVQNGLWILKNFEGINYKPASSYSSPKLLVRKTGVGISAAIDYTPAYTNQVVYIFRQKEDSTALSIPLEFFLAVLNSRAMYYFLTKRHGETEWRSHPYVTQSQILSLPLPNLTTLTKHRRLVDNIARMVHPHMKKGHGLPERVDASVERGVAKLLGLNKRDYGSIYATLENVQELLPVRKLKRIGLSDIFRSG